LDEGLTLNRPADSRDEDEDFEVEQEEEEQGRAKVAKERVRVLHEPKGKDGRKATGVVYWMSRDQRANDNWALLYAQRTCPPLDAKSPFTHARRSGDPHAELAVKSGVPLAVAFCLLPKFKGASIRYLPSPPQSLLCVRGLTAGHTCRHFGFMVRGLTEVEKNLNSRGIPMLLLKGLPQDELPKALKTYGASHLVCDFSPLRIGRKWREEVAAATNAFVYEGTSLPSTVLAMALTNASSYPLHHHFIVDAHNLVPLWEVSPKQEYAARTIRPKIHKQVPSTLP
jgi:deoxyribodipyrimidine photo-lyase